MLLLLRLAKPSLAPASGTGGSHPGTWSPPVPANYMSHTCTVPCVCLAEDLQDLTDKMKAKTLILLPPTHY